MNPSLRAHPITLRGSAIHLERVNIVSKTVFDYKANTL
jgi:hypothetical protein